MRRARVTRTLQVRYYRIWVRDGTEGDIKEEVLSLPHGPKQPAKVRDALMQVYGKDPLSILDTWKTTQRRSMTELEFFRKSDLIEEKEIYND